MQSRYSDIKNFGAELITISPQTTEVSKTLVENLALSFPVLSDVGNRVARSFGLVFTLAQEMRPIYGKFGIDIPGSNGDDTYGLPMPATYLIDTRGRIRLAHVNVDHTERLDPEIILEELLVLSGRA